jgi:broad specificity phosphatase PhoE
MSVLLLVRHGQASWGTDDYDRLSTLGVQQSRDLGRSLAQRGIRPDRLVTGAMLRHRQTGEAASEAGRWDAPLEIDCGWDEFDHLEVMARHPGGDLPVSSLEPRAFQQRFEDATRRWASGAHDLDYSETFPQFNRRIEDALRRLTSDVGRGSTTVVFSSGGPLAWAATHLLGAGPDVWARLNPVTVNTGVTLAVTSPRGTFLVTVNEHAHLPRSRITYR